MERISLSRGQALFAALALLVAGAVVALAATGGLALIVGPDGRLSLPDPARQRQLQELAASPEFDRFLEVVGLVRERYVREDVSLDALLVGATKGAVTALGDPYSFFYDAREFEELEINLGGVYSGIGVRVQEKGGYVIVLAPFPGAPGAVTPAAEGGRPGDPPGLQRGDRIVEVDGRDVVGMPVDVVARMIRGPEGSEVELVVQRDTDEGPRQLRFVIRRARIEIPTVEARMLPGGVGYLHLLEFLPQAPERVRAALAELRAQGMRGLVLDLRDNPGGDLRAAQEIASLFVPRGPVVHVVQRGGRRTTLESNSRGFDLPLVVLVNKGSASASEILAGAIRDRVDAPLVGETTFGKGSVQTVYHFDERGGVRQDGEGATGLKLTTAKWLTPDGHPIDGVGLKPDVEVRWEGTEGFGDPARDPQVRRAAELLRSRLGG